MSQLHHAAINDEQRRAVAILLAQFVREGVQFSAVSTDNGNEVIVTFTGGF